MTVVPEKRETDRLRKSKDANKTKDEENLKEWERETDFFPEFKKVSSLISPRCCLVGV